MILSVSLSGLSQLRKMKENFNTKKDSEEDFKKQSPSSSKLPEEGNMTNTTYPVRNCPLRGTAVEASERVHTGFQAVGLFKLLEGPE